MKSSNKKAEKLYLDYLSDLAGFVGYANHLANRCAAIEALFEKNKEALERAKKAFNEQLSLKKEEVLQSIAKERKSQHGEIKRYETILERGSKFGNMTPLIEKSLRGIKEAIDFRAKSRIEREKLKLDESLKQANSNIEAKVIELEDSFEKEKEEIISEFEVKQENLCREQYTFFDKFLGSNILDSQAWRNLNPLRKSTTAYLNVGEAVSNYDFFGKKYKVVNRVLVPFFNEKNIIIKYTSRSESKAYDFFNALLCRVMMAHQAGQVYLQFVDAKTLGHAFKLFSELNPGISKVAVERDEIESCVQFLFNKVREAVEKYLKPPFETIADYNETVDGAEEPYHMLVINDFPHGFSKEDLGRLLKIMENGPKAGVSTILLSNEDTLQRKNSVTQNDFDLEEYDVTSHLFDIGEAVYPLPNFFGDIRLHKTEDFSVPRIVKHVNNQIEEKEDVHVPFESHMLEESQWWRKKSVVKFGVPIGVSGKVPQYFEFNQKKHTHGLVIGMSGAGKSNLLHVLITNAVLTYSPEELDLYLVDFKAGTEFNIYAQNKLPHAKVIAVESEREFGLSVLQRLKSEMEKRGAIFKQSSVKDFPEYREKFPDEVMPRILLIVDEFQKFFQKDDRVRDEAERTIEALVREGRSYGINMLLASQTLAGASLPSEVRDLIYVRVALQCRDDDSRRILSDSNPAASALSRIGEGIYNDSLGQKEGNQKFQTFFLKKEVHERILAELTTYTQANNIVKDQIIFKGDEPARIEKQTSYFKELLREAYPKRMKVWLGEPMSISDFDVFMELERDSSANILIAGGKERIATKVLVSVMTNIMTAHAPGTAKFRFFDSIDVESDAKESLSLFRDGRIPFEVRFIKAKDVEKELAGIQSIIEERLSDTSLAKDRIYLSFSALQRSRQLRRLAEYDLSTAGQSLAYILKEGPDVGVFTVIQADNLNNLGRILDVRGMLKEFIHRISLQMTEDESLDLINSRVSATLFESQKPSTENRAYYYNEFTNTLVKFKPYELPNETWFKKVVGIIR